MLVQPSMQTGIVFAGERSELAYSVSSELKRLGYARRTTDIVTPELIEALNAWRRENSLPELGYIDPVSFRLLTGTEVGGDELILLAKYAERFPTDVERFEFCRESVAASRRMLVSLTQYLSGKSGLGALPEASESSVRCAVLAYLLR